MLAMNIKLKSYPNNNNDNNNNKKILFSVGRKGSISKKDVLMPSIGLQAIMIPYIDKRKFKFKRKCENLHNYVH